MGEQQTNITQELDILQKQIQDIIDENVKNEKNDVKSQIQKLSNRIEDILNFYGTAPRDIVATTVYSNNWRTIELVQKEVERIRQSESSNITSSIGSVNDKYSNSTNQEFHRFERSGGAQQDFIYVDSVERICNDLVDMYATQLGNRGSRGDEAYAQIKRASKKTSEELKKIHIEYSQKIKQEALSQLKEMGAKLNPVTEKQVDEKLDSAIESRFGGISDTLSSSTLSVEEVAINDTKYLEDEEIRDTNNVWPNMDEQFV